MREKWIGWPKGTFLLLGVGTKIKNLSESLFVTHVQPLVNLLSQANMPYIVIDVLETFGTASWGCKRGQRKK
jgi:hypothetical protein